MSGHLTPLPSFFKCRRLAGRHRQALLELIVQNDVSAASRDLMVNMKAVDQYLLPITGAALINDQVDAVWSRPSLQDGLLVQESILQRFAYRGFLFYVLINERESLVHIESEAAR